MMATYFHEGSEIQENMQTLYLMNPNYSYINIAAYSDAQNSQPQSNVLLLNALAQGSIPHAPPPPHQPFIAIPRSDNHGRPSSSSDNNHDHHRGDPLHGLSVSQGLSLSLSRNPGVSVSGAARGGVVVGSKYFKPAQELLDEVVSVGYQKGGGAHKEKGKEAAAASEVVAVGGSKVAAVLTEQLNPAQRQELQMKKAKLLNMLDEVEQRYRQYHSQMQAVVSSFEHEAGIDSAKSYTSLALKTISRQFRCLKDFICSQIKATNKSLGEDDQPADGRMGSRLRLVDHQLRQQKALEQLGVNMMPNHAWRPQRGLPERAVSVLRAWLFEHFLHPYPKDSDKHMLAKQTGLTRSQVSNWFINARVRLWKPMVEEMYLEEMKAQGQNGDNNSDNNNNNNANNSTTPSNNVSPSEKDHNKDHQPTSKPTAVAQQHQQQQHDCRGIGPGMMPGPQTTNDMISSDMVSLIEPTRSVKKQRTHINSSNIRSTLSTDSDTKPLDVQTQEGPGGSGFNAVYFANDMPTGRFNQLDHLTRPYGNNGVSLTLGLPRCENLSAHHQQDFLPNQGMQFEKRLEVGAQEADFWGIDIQSHKRFAAHQILHDFVA